MLLPEIVPKASFGARRTNAEHHEDPYASARFPKGSKKPKQKAPNPTAAFKNPKVEPTSWATWNSPIQATSRARSALGFSRVSVLWFSSDICLIFLGSPSVFSGFRVGVSLFCYRDPESVFLSAVSLVSATPVFAQVMYGGKSRTASRKWLGKLRNTHGTNLVEFREMIVNSTHRNWRHIQGGHHHHH